MCGDLGQVFVGGALPPFFFIKGSKPLFFGGEIFFFVKFHLEECMSFKPIENMVHTNLEAVVT